MHTAASAGTKPPSVSVEARPAVRKPARWRAWKLASLTVVAAAAVTLLLSFTTPFRILELKTYDWRFVLRGSLPAPGGIVLVLLDAETERALTDPRIFWQPHFANLLRATAAGNARAVGLDVFFAIPVDKWAPDADRDLAAAFLEVSAALPVVLAFETAEQGPAPPVYTLASSMSATGFANLTLDNDGFVRRQALASPGQAAQLSFAARLAAGSDAPGFTAGQGSLPLAGRTVPLDGSGTMRIHYWGPAGTFPSLSMATVLAARNDAAQLRRWFEGKTVLIGTAEASDQHPTPFYRSGRHWATPGVEIQASTTATIREGRFLRDAPAVWLPLLVAGAAALAAAAVFALPFSAVLPVLPAAAALYFLAAAYLQARGWVFPVVPPVFALALSGLGSYGVYAMTEGRQRRLLQQVFGRYVSPEIAREVLARGEIPLGGVRQQVTVLFSDLRNYTSYCQGRDPQLVVAELNEYFAEMTEAIKTHGGMVNKFIGDGIMAIFGAPLPHADDAVRAVRCGLEMVKRNEASNQRRTALGLDPLVIGVGIHTGEAVVGNIGASEKMEYTAIGDTVNVASRIEGENKTFGSRLLISEATWDRVRAQVAAELAGQAKLKGVTEPVALYKVLSFKGDGA